MENEIIKASEYGLEQKQVGSVDLAFAEKSKEREILSQVYGEILKKDITKEVAIEARDARLRAVKIKTGIASIHKTQKEFALAFGKYCDAWRKKETEPVQQMIDGLMEIEKHEERQEQERLRKLQEDRVALISEFIQDANERDLSSMEDDVWQSFFATKKQAHLDFIAAERKDEEDRQAKIKAEKLEQERIRKENEKLKAEAEEREKLAKKEADKGAKIEAERKASEEAERKIREDKEKKAREAHEAELKAEREERAIAEKKEQAKREKLEAELKAKQEAERKAKEAEEARLQTELNKGDSDKVKDLIVALGELKSKYSFKSAKNKKMYTDVGLLIDKVTNYIDK